MSRKHGIDANTFQRLVIDAGQLRLNYVNAASPGTLLAATRGGNVFSVEQEIREMAVDGARGRVKGGNRIIQVVPKITANILTWTSEILRLALPGASNTDYPTGGPYTHESIKRAIAIAAGDYPTSIAIVGEVSGSTQNVICIISNPLNIGNLEWNFTDKDESVGKIEFVGHFVTTDLDTEPWEVRWPRDVDGTTEGA